MKEAKVLIMVCALLGILGSAFIFGCTELTDGPEATESTSTTISTVSEATIVQPTTVESTTTTVASTSTAVASSTTTTAGGSSGTLVQIDPNYLQVSPNLVQMDKNLFVFPTRYEDEHPYLAWEGTWKVATGLAYSGGTLRWSTTKNSEVEAIFEGTGVQLVASRGPDGGTLVVHLTGPGTSKVEKIDLYNVASSHQEKVWYSGYLTKGQYAVYFEYDDSNSPGERAYVDAIEIWGQIAAP